jgi:hypothetical protein
MVKTTSELLRSPAGKGEGARETHGADAHAPNPFKQTERKLTPKQGHQTFKVKTEFGRKTM